MDELSPEARRLLIAARAHADPTSQDRARVAALLTSAIAAGTASSAAASASGPAATGASGVIAKVAAGAFAATIAVASVYGLTTWIAQPVAPTAKPAAPTTLATAPAPIIAAPAPTSAAPEAIAETSVSAVSGRAARRSHARPTPTTHVADEVQWIARAEAALEAGSLAAAQQALAEHAKRYPHGELQEERIGLQAIVMCSSTRTADAKQRANAFLARHPTSVLAQRVSSACGDADGVAP